MVHYTHGIIGRTAEYRLFYRALLQKRPIILLSIVTLYGALQTWHHISTVIFCSAMYEAMCIVHHKNTVPL